MAEMCEDVGVTRTLQVPHVIHPPPSSKSCPHDLDQSQEGYRLPRWLSGKEFTCQCRRCGFDPWVRKTSWRGKCQPTPVFLPGESHHLRKLAGYSPWGRNELDITERIHFISLSILEINISSYVCVYARVI